MTESVTFYYILAAVGSAAMIAVAVLYFIQKRMHIRRPRFDMYQKHSKQTVGTKMMNNELDIRTALAPHRDDQPVFLKIAEDLMTRVRSRSEIKVLKEIVREFEVSAELIDTKRNLLQKMEAYKETEHSYETQPVRLQRKDEIDELTHQRDVAKLKNDTRRLNNPPRPPKEKERLTHHDVAKLRKEEQERKLEEARLVFQHEVRFLRMRDDILGTYQEEQRTKRVRLLDKIKDDLAERRVSIQSDPMLSPMERETQLRALQKEFMRQLDGFESKL